MVVRSLFNENRRREIQAAIRAGKLELRKPMAEDAWDVPIRFPPRGRMPDSTMIDRTLDSPDYVPLSPRDRKLLKAAYENDNTSALEALKSGANPDIRDSAAVAATIMMSAGQTSRSWGDTPLMIASKNGNLGLARMLIQFKANVNLDYSYGSCPMPTALSYAREDGNVEIERELLAAGATR